MSWSADAPASSSGHTTVFDTSASDTDVEVARGFADDVEQQRPKDNDSLQKRLTLTFKNVTVNVTAPGEALGDTLWSWADPSQLVDVFRKPGGAKRVLSLPSCCYGLGTDMRCV